MINLDAVLVEPFSFVFLDIGLTPTFLHVFSCISLLKLAKECKASEDSSKSVQYLLL